MAVVYYALGRQAEFETVFAELRDLFDTQPEAAIDVAFVYAYTGDVDQADELLDFFPYWHTGWFGSYKLDRVFEMYRAFQEKLSFTEWVEKEYRIPEPDRKPEQDAARAPPPTACIQPCTSGTSAG